ncbi:MAG: type II toxin-antitoxin system VapC family toxin [Dolichospermum sp. DET50]|nr:type II toxin-antitoxin system VapC family toxin [Dolichospermum sp. DET66]MBS3034407.1 type II toxin-antitoxin system VapC family toxin [Dolichospermum sp. DET67]MBS3039610.1 type II toxin-antitoxin system VapC family toxin [Dolichospermum sp. DET50]QSX66820.1 MAG: type II toxin-antitoxin system VapC family toxin [Dolichospermum sp. DET69]
MLYLIDTNVCVMYLNGRSTSISDRILSLPTKDIAVCSVVKAELFYGAMKSNNLSRTLQRQKAFLDHYESLPFNDQSASIFGNIRAQLTAQGTPIGAYDLQIAAIALANNLILVTHNTREFSRVLELQLEDWEIV